MQKCDPLQTDVVETKWEVRGIVKNKVWDSSGRPSSVSMAASSGTVLSSDAMQSYN